MGTLRRAIAAAAVVPGLAACNPFPSYAGLSEQAPEAAAPGDAGTCDVDLASASDNCGACGHSCLGGACEAGQCLPVALASGEPSPYGLALDDTRVYWTQWVAGGAVRSIDKTGDASTLRTVVPGLLQPEFLAVDDANVYVTLSGGPLVRAPKSGAASAEVLTPPYAGMHDVALDDSSVYYSVRETDGGVYFLSKDGGAPAPFASANQAGSIAIDAQNVYWAEYGGGTDKGRISSRPRGDAQGPITVYSSYEEDAPDGIAVDATSIYWTHFAMTGGVSKIAKDQSTAPFLLNAAIATTNGIATDGASVFFTSYTMGSVSRVPTGGGPTVTLAQQTDGNPIRIATDDRFVYWTSSASAGAVYRLAK